MDAKKTAKDLTDFLKKHENLSYAPKMKKYMRDKFEFIGLKKDIRQALCIKFWENNTPPAINELQELVIELWKSPYRELHYHALEMMAKQLKKLDSTWIPFWEKLLVQNSWWDSVDFLIPRLISPMLLNYPALMVPYSLKWIDSDNFWLQRSAIIFQLKYKDKTNQQLLFDYILSRADSKEFFVQKASGWALREYTKTNPNAVIHFVETYKDLLSNLTKREALRLLIK